MQQKYLRAPARLFRRYGIQSKQVAKLLGVDASTVSKWEGIPTAHLHAIHCAFPSIPWVELMVNSRPDYRKVRAAAPDRARAVAR